MVVGDLPFDEKELDELYKKITTADYKMPNFLSKPLRDLISKILVVDPAKRLTIESIKKHCWVTGKKEETPKKLFFNRPTLVANAKRDLSGFKKKQNQTFIIKLNDYSTNFNFTMNEKEPAKEKTALIKDLEKTIKPKISLANYLKKTEKKTTKTSLSKPPSRNITATDKSFNMTNFNRTNVKKLFKETLSNTINLNKPSRNNTVSSEKYGNRNKTSLLTKFSTNKRKLKLMSKQNNKTEQLIGDQSFKYDKSIYVTEQPDKSLNASTHGNTKIEAKENPTKNLSLDLTKKKLFLKKKA